MGTSTNTYIYRKIKECCSMRIVAMSDIHLFHKTDRICCAMKAAENPDILLLAGDLADRAQKEQYSLLSACIRDCLDHVLVYSVMGNHDNPFRDDTAFRAFELSFHAESGYDIDDSGAFYSRINDNIDIIGLNPVYHQKIFFFPERGRQLQFLESMLIKSDAEHHIVMCHPPLIAHNPQRCGDMSPYISKEQDSRLQNIINNSKNVIFISGHTHMAPVVEVDERRSNVYINNGSICPTTTGKSESPVQQGNITILNIDEQGIHVCIKGIHTPKEFFSGYVSTYQAT